MRNRRVETGIIFLVSLVWLTSAVFSQDEQPRVVNAPEGSPPADAIILFDGANLDAWQHPDGSPASWTVASGVVTVRRNAIMTKREFGDIQLHLEFQQPPPSGTGQDRGNSGVYFQAAYEVQILDSYQSETYPNGQCGAVYEEHPPLVNASRPPGKWQVYDIIFRAPKFDSDGNKIQKPNVTVFHNGVLIQDHAEISGTTRASLRTTEHPTGPLYLQDHNHPVKYRNIWLREL